MPDRPMPDHQLEAFRRDPHDCSASEVMQLVDEIDRLRSLRDDIARAVRGDTFDVLRDFDRLPEEIKSQHEDASDAADYVGVVYGLVHKLRGELPDGEDEHPGTWLENWVDGTLAENNRLREESNRLSLSFEQSAEVTGELRDEIDRLGDRVADLELDNEGLQRTLAENDRLREGIATLTETVRDVAESLALGAASPAAVALAVRTLHTACGHAEGQD